MDKQNRTVMAFIDMAVKYLTPQNKIFFKEEHCYLCDIHLKRTRVIIDGQPATFSDGRPAMQSDCRGCPLASFSGTCGCAAFRTYKRAQEVYRSKNHIENGDPCLEFIERATFFIKHLITINQWPTSRFTKKGWSYSGDEISREFE